MSNSITKFILSIALAASAASARAGDGPGAFEDYINGRDYRKHYGTALFLGMFNSQADADRMMHERLRDPLQLQEFDAIFAFGADGGVMKVWEISRVTADNLSFSVQTNYAKLEGLSFDRLFAHSNGNDVMNNSLKAGLIFAKDVFAIAPPAGFIDEARNLPVDSVHIYRTPGDPVAEKTGKGLLFWPLQKLGDLDIGLIRVPNTDELLAGLKVTRGGGHTGTPKVEETVFSGPDYISKSPHLLETNFANMAIKQTHDNQAALAHIGPSSGGDKQRRALEEQTQALRNTFPLAREKMDVDLRIESQVKALDQRKSSSLSSAPPPPPPPPGGTTAQEGGVNMRMDVTEASIQKDSTGRLDAKRAAILGSHRETAENPSWTPEPKENQP